MVSAAVRFERVSLGNASSGGESREEDMDNFLVTVSTGCAENATPGTCWAAKEGRKSEDVREWCYGEISAPSSSDRGTSRGESFVWYREPQSALVLSQEQELIWLSFKRRIDDSGITVFRVPQASNEYMEYMEELRGQSLSWQVVIAFLLVSCRWVYYCRLAVLTTSSSGCHNKVVLEYVIFISTEGHISTSRIPFTLYFNPWHFRRRIKFQRRLLLTAFLRVIFFESFIGT